MTEPSRVHLPAATTTANGATLRAKKFELDSTLDFVADHFTIESASSVIFRGAAPTDKVTIKAGLRPVVGDTIEITALTDGPIDEYELVVTPDSIVQRLRGRDLSSRVLDRRYINAADPTGGALFARPQQALAGAVVESIPESLTNPAILAKPAQTGFFTAKGIATQVVESVGLKLQWEVPDYPVLAQRFIASGRIMDVIRTLAAPWNAVEPFKVDILLEKDTVIVRQRGLALVNGTITTPDFVFDLTALRRSQLTIRKRRLRKVGPVILRGQRLPNNRGPVLFGGGLPGAVTSGGTESHETSQTAFDAGGNVTSLITTVETYRVPDRILVASVKSTHTGGAGVPLKLTLRESVENTWEPSVYDVDGNAVNRPKQTEQRIMREGIDPADEDQLFRQLGDEATQYEYDELGFLDAQTTTARKLDLESGNLDYDRMIVKTIHDAGPLFIEEVTEQYAFDTTGSRWNLTNRDTALSAGYRPGGPGRGASRAGMNRRGQVGATDANVIIEKVISSDDDAVEFEFSNENMTLENLEYICQLLELSSGMIELELQFDGITMPWVKRGQTIQFSGILLEDGTPLILPIVLLTDVQTAYDESSATPQYVMRCRAFGWKRP